LSPAQGKVTQVKIMLMPSSLNQVKERLKEESSWQAQGCGDLKKNQVGKLKVVL
jgi:hypothetical protein